MIRTALALAAAYYLATRPRQVQIPGEDPPRPAVRRPLQDAIRDCIDRVYSTPVKEVPMSLFEAQHQRVNQLLAEVREGVTLPAAAREELKRIVHQGANLVEQAQAALDETRNVKPCARNSRDWDPRKITLLDPKPPVSMP